MCSISGCLIFKRSRTDKELYAIEDKVRTLVIRGEERGRDSFGIVSFQNNGRVLEIKKDSKPSQSLAAEPHFVFPTTTAVINNDRAEPTTEYVTNKADKDIQPFGSTIYVSHNGIIANDHELEAKYHLDRNTSIDSAVLPPLLETLWDGTCNGLQKILRDEIVGSYALAVADKRNPTKLFLACNYKPIFLEYDRQFDALFFTSLESYLGQSDRPIWDANAVRQMEPYSLLSIDSEKRMERFSLWREDAGKETRALVVCSAGLDSTTAAKVMIDRGYDTTLLHFKYRHRAEKREEESIRRIAEFLKAKLMIVDTSLFKDVIGHSRLTETFEQIEAGRFGEAGAEFAHEWVPARNLIFLAVATGIAEGHGFGTIVLGNNLEESVAPDTTIYSRINGSWQLNRIDDLYHKWSKGEISALETYSINSESLKLEVSRVRKVIRHSTLNKAKKLYEITLRNGKTIKVTEDHSLIIFDRLDGAVKGIAVRALDKGKHLLMQSNKELSTNEEKRVLDLTSLFPILRKYKVWIRNGDGKKIRLSHFLQKRRQTGYAFDNHCLRLVPKTRSYSIPVRIPLSSTLLEFFGLWVADGHFDRYGLGITKDWSNDYAKFWSRLQSYFRNVFGFTLPDIYQKNPTIMINFDLFKKVMHSLGWVPKTSARRGLHKNVPDWIFTLSKLQIAAFLRGYFSGDGSVSTKRRTVKVTSVNKGLIERVNELLTILGIHTALSREKSQYCLSITRVKSIQQFKVYVGFIDQRKQFRLAEVVKAAKSLPYVRSWEIGFPNFQSFPELLYSLPLSGRYKSSIGMASGSRTAYDYYRREPLIDAMNDLGDGMYTTPKITNVGQCPVCGIDTGSRNRVFCSKSCYSKAMRGSFIHRRKYLADPITIGGIRGKILKIAESDLHYLKIKSIRELDTPRFVYDLSVENNENFLAANGIVLHNSGAYPDNEMMFINKLNEVLPYATNLQKKVRLEMPVGNLMKHEIVRLGVEIGAPLDLTWSCYEGGNDHCGRCGPCYMRRKAFEINGLHDPVQYEPISEQPIQKN